VPNTKTVKAKRVSAAQLEKERIEYENRRYKVYLKERKRVIDADNANETLSDKSIITLTSGAFAVSLTFIANMFTKCQSIQYPGWLMAAFVGFGASMVLTLISFQVSHTASEDQIHILDREYRENLKERQRTRWAKPVELLNIASSMLFFILGTVALPIFVYYNLAAGGAK
jgi:hypothetical protein